MGPSHRLPSHLDEVGLHEGLDHRKTGVTSPYPCSRGTSLHSLEVLLDLVVGGIEVHGIEQDTDLRVAKGSCLGLCIVSVLYACLEALRSPCSRCFPYQGYREPLSPQSVSRSEARRVGK